MVRIAILCLERTIPFLGELVEALEENFHARLTMKNANFFTKSFDEQRKQYDAEVLLDEVCSLEIDADKVLAVFSGDLFVSRMNFVFGLAGGKSCLISLARLKCADKNVFKERLVKEALHELGHTFGLQHCLNKKCVMVFSNSVSDVDFKGREFCEKCREKLEILLKNV